MPEIQLPPRTRPFVTILFFAIALFLIGLTMWSNRDRNLEEGAAVQSQCAGTPLLVNTSTKINRTDGTWKRRSNYWCVPGYFRSPKIYVAESGSDTTLTVTAERSWLPTILVTGLIALIWATIRHSRRQKKVSADSVESTRDA